MAKSPDAFRTISEVADWLEIQAHVLRFWESKFTQVKPIKRAGGRRYYRPTDMLLLGGIKRLLHEDGMTIKGVQKILREDGMSHVADLSGPLDELTLSQLDDLPKKNIEAPMAQAEPEPEETGVVLSFESRTVEETAPSAPAENVDEQPAPPATAEENAKEAAGPEADTAEPVLDEAEPAVEMAAPIADIVEPVTDDAEPAAEVENTSSEDSTIISDPKTAEESPPQVSEPQADEPQVDEPQILEPEQESLSASPPEMIEEIQAPSPVSAEQDNAGSETEVEQPGPEPVVTDVDVEPELELTPELPFSAPVIEKADEDQPVDAVADQLDSPAEPEPVTPQPEATPSLPTFLRRPMTEPENVAPEPSEPAIAAQEPEPEQVAPPPPEPPAPKPRVVHVPAFTPEADFAATPGTLSNVYRLRKLNQQQASEIAPFLDRLTTLRDSMLPRRRMPPSASTQD